MVRETRHLWVGNLPDNIREDRIREHFKRYGRVQNIKLLGRTESASAGSITGTNASPAAGANVASPAAGNSGVCATVAFMDIKSASKAHNAEHVLDECTLTTEYYEPAAIPSAAAGAPSAGSSPAGSGYSGSSSSMNSTPGPTNTSRYHLSGGEESNGCPSSASVAAQVNWRGTNDSATEYCRRGNTPAGYGRYQRNSGSGPYSTPPPSNVDRTPPVARWGEGEEGARRRSGSSSSGSSSVSPSDTSRASSPRPPTHLARTDHHIQRSSTGGRPLAICVRNLPARSTDSSLKDGLYHEYKKHGKVVWVKVVGQNADRYAIVRFKKPSDVDKALEVSQDKLFFGCKISVAPHQSCDEDAESAKPFETDIDEYHPKATRTLFIGNLEKDVTQQQLRDKFKHFGRIIEIDIKKGSSGGGGYAFCQYASISSVVEAIRAMDGEYVGASRVKLGFGKPVATTCVWVDGLTELAEKQVVAAVGRSGAATAVTVDRAAGAALVHFEQAAAAAAAVRELRRLAAHHASQDPDRRLAVDYASRECQDAFYEQLEKHGGAAALAGTERLPPVAHHTARYEGSSRSRAGWRGRARYSVDHYDTTEYADRRYRVYDEIGSSPQTEEAQFEERLQSVVVSPHRSRRHRRDSSPDEHKHSKERHRSSSGTCARSRTGRRRSGSGGRRRHRRRHGEGGSSRAGTPLRDEPAETWPSEPRRPPLPRDRSEPMMLPLPKFALLLRAPAEPPMPRPPSAASSSSAGSAPHSPSLSLEERIRSLDEKYERWSRPEAPPERTRPRHRLLELDINEVKPSDVVKSLLAKRSVFDEDSERLEGAGSSRPPSLLHPFPTHDDQPLPSLPNGIHNSTKDYRLEAFVSETKSENIFRQMETENLITRSTSLIDISDKTSDPRLNRIEKQFSLDRLNIETEIKFEPRLRPRTPSTESSSQFEASEKSFKSDRDTTESEKILEIDQQSENDNKTESERSLIDSFHDTKEESPSRLLKSEKNENPVSDYEDKIKCDQTSEQSENSDNIKKIEESNQIPLQHIEQLETKSECLTENSGKTVAEKLNTSQETQSAIDDEIRKLSDSYITTDTKPGSENLSLNNSKEIVCLKTEIKTEPTAESKITLSDTFTPEKESTAFVLESIKQEETEHSKGIFDSNSLSKKDVSDSQFVTKDRRKSLETTSITKVHETQKSFNENVKTEREKMRSSREKYDSDKRTKSEKLNNKQDKDKKNKEESLTESLFTNKIKSEYETDVKLEKSKHDKDKHQTSTQKDEKSKSLDDKVRHDHHKREKYIKDKRRDSDDHDSKNKKDDKHKHDQHKHERHKKEHSSDSRRDRKDTESKSRKSSRDESSREIYRKDSTDSTTSRASHESNKIKENDSHETKDDKQENKNRHKSGHEKHKHEKEISIKLEETVKLENCKVKLETKEEHTHKPKTEATSDFPSKLKPEIYDKQRHHSLDSPCVDNKRKERLNSSSSLPPNIGQKRRVSYQDSVDSLPEDVKKPKCEKLSEKRNSRDSKTIDKPKTAKFSKGHFAKLIESKTKDEKKNQVKPPDESSDVKELRCKEFKFNEDSSHPKDHLENKHKSNCVSENEGLQNHLDFLATLELRVNSSEEDETTKALRKEMKEKKRLQQLQQIQELQMQQDALQQAELKDRKIRDEKRKEVAREKRMSTDRKSKDEKTENKRKTRKTLNSSDTSDSDEPKKHSIFDIVDDGPTYISMYDKVKARSCKNMQKQEEEKRQEKIKAKFSQLKQSRAKREEKKRCSWDEDSDSDPDTKKHHKSVDSTSEDDLGYQQRKHDLMPSTAKMDYFTTPNSEDDSRNKLSRKNSRSRILSDTSDEESLRRMIAKSPGSYRPYKKDMCSDSESLQSSLHSDFFFKQDLMNSARNNSLINLFGKSDSDDCKNKSGHSLTGTEYKGFLKASHDFSSENESFQHVYSFGEESRKKHKKKQKKNRSSPAEDENKQNLNESHPDINARLKSFEKSRKHSKKEKRKEKIRESFDTDDNSRDEIIKAKNKTLNNITNENILDASKKDGKMEDIFGPLSDESDSLTICTAEEIITNSEYSASINNKHLLSNFKEKDEIKRRKEKKRKEKRHVIKEEENSLDVDAVGKAIEARLFSDDITEDEEPVKNESTTQSFNMRNINIKRTDIGIDGIDIDKVKKDVKEKKKKKKKNRDDRLNRKEHHSHRTVDQHLYRSEEHRSHKIEENIFNNSEHIKKGSVNEMPIEPSPGTNKLDTANTTINLSSPSESPSLPRLTDSPIKTSSISSDYIIDTTKNLEMDNKSTGITIKPPEKQTIEKMDSSSSCDIKNDAEATCAKNQSSNDNAVRSISNLEQDHEQTGTSIVLSKHDEKVEEKPRAVISQEETEDAVAALLGESFGGGDSTFRSRFDEDDDRMSENVQNASVENDNILEEDAEEMRRAVQNLNASELEMKPDTPVSDNDLLLIDTDTDDADETESVEKPLSISMSTNLNLIPNSNSSTIENKDTKIKEVLRDLSDNNVIGVGSSGKAKSPEKEVIRESNQTAISTANPVITSLTLTNNKVCEPYLLNITKGNLPHLDANDNKNTKHITANIIQIKAPHAIQTPTSVRPILGTPNRLTAPYQVINQVIRPQNTNMQPPVIKIPDQQIVYQKSQNIVISPRMSNDPRLLSPKPNASCETSNTQQMKNVTILSTSPQHKLSVSLASQSAPQRPPGHVTVVRMQQPPLSPIQAMHIPPGTRTMISPNRPNSVLVQTQGASLNFNRSPMTPVLAPISKPINTNILQANKLGVVTSPIIQPKSVPVDRRNEIATEGSRIIFSTANLQHSTNPTVMAQNRLISMQNAIHVGNITSKLPFPSKVLINSVNTITEKNDNMNNSYKADTQKPETPNSPFNSAPIIRVAGINSSSNHIIQTSGIKTSFPMSEGISAVRDHGSNVIHSVNQQRMLSTAPLTNVIQIDANKGTPSVLSMSCARTPTVLTKLATSPMPTSSSVSSVVMTPLLVKTTNTSGLIKNLSRAELEERSFLPQDNKDRFINLTSAVPDLNDTRKDLFIKPAKISVTAPETISKCETDFEELLRDNTNKIKITKDSNIKFEVSDVINVFEHKDQHPLNIPNKDDFKSSLVRKDVEQNDKSYQQHITLEKKTFDNIDNKQSSINTPIHLLKSDDKDKHAIEESNVPPLTVEGSQTSDKHADENDLWTAKDVNIESVIKKVDSLCNDINDDLKEETFIDNDPSKKINTATQEPNKQIEIDTSTTDESLELPLSEDIIEKSAFSSKRGGRSTRGKKHNKNTDKVQTRQINKPTRGGSAGKRGRGRATTDKKPRTTSNTSSSNLPGDVYDFHEEDSGDETANTTGKTESRPRLILTIKSPISNTTVTTAATGIQKELQFVEKNTVELKDEKPDEFASPSVNTRKSRRLLEKDVQKTNVDDVEEGNKVSVAQTQAGKEIGKKRPTRQAAAKLMHQDKNNEPRKTNKGVKRPRNTSSSDTSLDSNDEKNNKKEECPSDAKIPKIAESVVQTPAAAPVSTPMNIGSVTSSVISTPSTSAPLTGIIQGSSFATSVTVSNAMVQSASSVSLPIVSAVSVPAPSLAAVSVAVTTQSAAALSSGVVNTVGVVTSAASLPPVLAPTPIMKPPKKMISEISAKLAGVGAVAGGADTAEARVSSPALPTRAPPRAPHLPAASLPRGATIHQHHPGSASRIAVPHLSPQGAQMQMSAGLVRSPPPAHQQTSPVTPGDGMYPHFSHQHYQMYQQHFRATQQDSRATPSPYTRSLEAEGCEAPPLELRRPLSARLPRPAHSPAPALPLVTPASHIPPATHDRLIMYPGGRGGRSPPPAHGGRCALPATGGPLHASQVPREADSLQMLLRRYPVMWQGLLALKNDAAAVQMHFVGGNPAVANNTLPCHTDGSTPPLRIAQRMRLEPQQLDQVHRKMKLDNEHCMLLALPCGRDHMDVLQQSTNLTSGFITYLQRKQAAGIVNIAPPGHHQAQYTVHIFPSCEFANENLNRIAPDLMHRVADIAHLLIVIATV